MQPHLLTALTSTSTNASLEITDGGIERVPETQDTS